jgi:hypothetical protein
MVRTAGFFAALLLVNVVLAGCSQAPSQPSGDAGDGKNRGVASISPEGDTNATGAIDGKVIDDEGRPVANAALTIIGFKVEVLSTSDGLFKFEKVPIGKHVVAVSAISYKPKTQGIQVAADATANMLITLEPLPILQPRHISLPHTFYIHFGAYGTSFAGGNTSSCEACEWTPKIEADPDYVIIEIRGKHTVKYPTRPDGLAVFLYKNSASGGYIRYCGWIGTDNNPECIRLPMRFEYNKTYLDSVAPVDKPTTAIRFWQWCDPFWVCVEERYDEWFTLFYDMDEASIPKDFTAWPPE